MNLTAEHDTGLIAQPGEIEETQFGPQPRSVNRLEFGASIIEAIDAGVVTPFDHLVFATCGQHTQLEISAVVSAFCIVANDQVVVGNVEVTSQLIGGVSRNCGIEAEGPEFVEQFETERSRFVIIVVLCSHVVEEPVGSEDEAVVHQATKTGSEDADVTSGRSVEPSQIEEDHVLIGLEHRDKQVRTAVGEGVTTKSLLIHIGFPDRSLIEGEDRRLVVNGWPVRVNRTTGWSGARRSSLLGKSARSRDEENQSESNRQCLTQIHCVPLRGDVLMVKSGRTPLVEEGEPVVSSVVKV